MRRKAVARDWLAGVHLRRGDKCASAGEWAAGRERCEAAMPNGDCSISENRHEPKSVRLDGSTITQDEVVHAVVAAKVKWKVPGVGLAIINDGRVVYANGFGERDVEQKLPLTKDTVMYAASLTKSVFGYTVMQLVDQKVIALDTPISEYLAKPLPEYDNYKDLAGDERWRKFTPRMLLDHTSGLSTWRGFEDDKKVHIHFEPGTRYSYSNEGINLLGMVVEEDRPRSRSRRLCSAMCSRPSG